MLQPVTSCGKVCALETNYGEMYGTCGPSASNTNTSNSVITSISNSIITSISMSISIRVSIITSISISMSISIITSISISISISEVVCPDPVRKPVSNGDSESLSSRGSSYGQFS